MDPRSNPDAIYQALLSIIGGMTPGGNTTAGAVDALGTRLAADSANQQQDQASVDQLAANAPNDTSGMSTDVKSATMPMLTKPNPPNPLAGRFLLQQLSKPEYETKIAQLLKIGSKTGGMLSIDK